MAIPVGIDDINIYASTLVIENSALAAARGIGKKDLQNLGILCRSVLPTYEDPVTLAVNAAKPIVDAADPEDFELLIVATETNTDSAKPLSSYVHRYLGLGAWCRNFDTKHACYAGTAALQMATAWVRSGVARGKKALVIATDIARPHFNEQGELATGSGSVAMSIATEPRVFEIEPYSGYASEEVYDSCRPTPIYEWVDRLISLGSYLDRFEMAWEKYRQVVGPVSVEEHFDYMSFHTPLISLVKQAYQLISERDRDDVTRDEIAANFERMVRPSLHYNQFLGNTYSGSVYAGLAGILKTVAPFDRRPRVGCCSYGSGACAEIFSGLIGPAAYEIVAAKRIDERLAARRRLSVAEYEAAVLAIERSFLTPEFNPDWKTPLGHFEEAYAGKNLLVLEGVRNYHRAYQWS